MCMSVAKKLCLGLGLIGLVPALSFAGLLPERFTLGRYVPDDVWFVVHSVDNPERAAIEEQWGEVFSALKDSGIDRDLTTLVLSLVGEEDRPNIEANIDKATKLIRGVRWGDLVGREFLFAERIAAGNIGAAYIALAYGAENSGEANFAGLLAILKELSSVIAGAKLVESQQDGVTVWSLGLANEGLKKLDFGVELFRKGDLIGLTTGSGARNDVLALLAGKKEPRALVDSPRFREAITQVPPPQDMVMYTDVKRLVGDIGRMFEAITAEQGKQKKALAPDPSQKAVEQVAQEPCTEEAGTVNSEELAREVIRKVLDLADFIDYGVTSVETKGRRELTHAVMRIQPGKQDSPVAGVFFKRRPFEKFDRFIPAEATGFSLTGFFDIEGAYRVLTDIVKGVPGGAEKLAEVDAALASVGLDLQGDFFNWWSGEMISVSLPAAVPTPMGGDDGVWMVRVKDAKLASEKVNAAIDFIAEKMQGQGQVLMVSPAQVNAEGFRQITHPAVAMFLRPVVGVHGDWLILGSSPAAVNKCLDVEAGKAPSILANVRFKEEGLIPEGAVQSASFRDTSKFGQELAAVVSMVGMFGGIAVAGIPEDAPDNRKVKSVFQSLLGMALKLGPVLQKIDFYSSESRIGTYDGTSTVRIESVVTYKPPPPPKPPAPAEPPTPANAPEPTR